MDSMTPTWNMYECFDLTFDSLVPSCPYSSSSMGPRITSQEIDEQLDKYGNKIVWNMFYITLLSASKWTCIVYKLYICYVGAHVYKLLPGILWMCAWVGLYACMFWE